MISKMSIKRPVTTIMALFIAVLCGIVSLLGLDMDLMPAVDIPVAVVSTTYVGAGPEEIETLVTKPIEEALGTVSNVSSISSISSSNSSLVMIEFEDGTDIDMAALDMREKVDLVKSFLPKDCDEPMVFKIDISQMTAINVGVSSSTMELHDLSALVEDNMQSRIERIEGVASVDLIGTLEKEVEIVLDSWKLEGYGVTESQISGVLAQENINYPSGRIYQGDKKLLLRSVGEFKSIEEIRDLPIMTPGGALIRLSDVATVNEVIKENSSYATVNGETSVLMSISKQSNANLVDVSDDIKSEFAKIESEYGGEISILIPEDSADYIKTSVNNVLSTAVQAAIMAVIVLIVFLRDPKTSLVIGVSIPTSVLATFALMYVNNMTLNVISLGGITLGIGMLVDNSVVVLENIYRYSDNGYDPKEASYLGSKEVAGAVAASTLTTVAVFIPLMFITGMIGQIFKDLSLTVTFSLLMSLIVSITFVPMACSKLLAAEKKEKKENVFSKFLDKWGNGIDAIDNFYRKVLTWCLKNKKKTIGSVIAAFIVSIGLVAVVGVDLMPVMDEGMLTINIELPSGVVLEETQKIVDEVTKEIDDIEEVDFYYVLGGSGFSITTMGDSTNTASITVSLVDKKSRNLSSEQVAEIIRERLKLIAGAEFTVGVSSSAMGSYAGGDISIQINGDDNQVLRSIGEDLVEVIKSIEGTGEVTSSSEEVINEANITINRARASVYGITAVNIGSSISNAVTGSVATQYKVDGTEIDVRIKRDTDTIKYINDIENLKVASPTGIAVPLSEIATITIDEGTESITRIDQHRYITVSANASGIDLSSLMTALEEKLEAYNFPPGYGYKFTGTLEEMGDTYTNLILVLVVAVLLVYMIMAAQFESFIYPFLIMFSIPLALTGGIFGLFVTGNTITITAFMGFIMLVGMVVNNAIVLVDYTNQLRERGMGYMEALIEAGPTRLRPILMTTLTTAIGLIPTALAMGEGTEMQRPLAIVCIFGLMISTVVTLVFIPVLYAGLEKYRFRSLSEKNKRRKIAKKEKKEQKKVHKEQREVNKGDISKDDTSKGDMPKDDIPKDLD